LGSLFLLWKGQIYLDRETKQVIEIELPFNIKLRSNIPVLALVLIGGMLLIYSATQGAKIHEEVTVDGDLSGSSSRIELYASVASITLPSGGPFSLSVPVTHPGRKYMLLYAIDGDLLAHQFFDPQSSDGRVLPALQITPPASAQKLIGNIEAAPPGY
ncbi:MAG TPA: hypothetical protein VHK24_01105, partial [Steroidobacter sp.]|nr:hypothetical protein [Steroidobacter sp.]